MKSLLYVFSLRYWALVLLIEMKFDILEYWNLSWKSHGILDQQVCTNPENVNIQEIVH